MYVIACMYVLHVCKCMNAMLLLVYGTRPAAQVSCVHLVW